MENVCKMDCHTCTLQEGNENKALCAALFMPTMMNRLSVQLQRIELALAGKSDINEVVLEVKPNKKKKDESIEE